MDGDKTSFQYNKDDMLNKKIAIISSGFLRNYNFFLKTNFYKNILRLFDCDIFISTWNEDGYGGNDTISYTEDIITEEKIVMDFGAPLKFLYRESFQDKKILFKYDTVKNLLRGEPHVLEKYRSKFYSLNQIKIDDSYDIYIHIRFDLSFTDDLSTKIIDCLSNFNKNENNIYTSLDIFNRTECFGDSFQVLNYQNFIFLQKFYSKLYDNNYLNLDIPHIPEKILYYYFNSENKNDIIQIPAYIHINRTKFNE